MYSNTGSEVPLKALCNFSAVLCQQFAVFVLEHQCHTKFFAPSETHRPAWTTSLAGQSQEHLSFLSPSRSGSHKSYADHPLDYEYEFLVILQACLVQELINLGIKATSQSLDKLKS